MTLQDLPGQIWHRLQPAGDPVVGAWSVLALVVALVLVLAPPLWRLARLAVTIVHELGHAVIGILVGRRFTGFVVNGDMSGHAVTVGPRRGLGRVASAWAGYPAPGVVGAALVAISFGGWSRPVLGLAVALLLVSLVFVRSAHTLLVVLGAIVLLGASWWWGGAMLAAGIALGAGTLLLLGAWRHLGAVARHGRRADDPAQLADLTGVPAGLWLLSYALVLVLCTWWALGALLPHLPQHLMDRVPFL